MLPRIFPACLARYHSDALLFLLVAQLAAVLMVHIVRPAQSQRVHRHEETRRTRKTVHAVNSVSRAAAHQHVRDVHACLQAEDDGAVLAMVTGADGGSFLLILDAASFEEVARIKMPIGLPYGFHGTFIPAK